MKLRPAEQEKRTNQKKQLPKREQKSTRPTSRQAASKETPVKVSKAGLAETSKEVRREALFEETPEAPLPGVSPTFVRRDLTGPDGTVRPGWEMWIGDHCFGRADSKELLLASFERLQSPPSSFHWREVRNRMPMRGRTKAVQGGETSEAGDTEEGKEESWEWGKKEEEPLLEGEDEGFQELTWENLA